MIKIWKIILIVIACLGFGGFLFWGYWSKTEGPAIAVDYNSNTEIICEEPIPVGIAIDKTVDFLDEIYQLYQGDKVKTASKQVDALMTDIAGKGGKICDFNAECKAQVGTGGPDAALIFDPLFLPPVRLNYTVPSCKLKEATGNPCPDLGKYVGEQSVQDWLNSVNPETISLDGLANSLTAQAQNVHDLFGGQTSVVPYGLDKEGEKVGETRISKAEEVRRYIAGIEFWLTPNAQKNTCALSELDRKRIEQGKMGDKYPMQCLEALHQDMYVPKAWSETCQDECETFTQECKDCLAECKGSSVYASLNCKIYSTGSGGGAVNKGCIDEKCLLNEDACVKDKLCGENCIFSEVGEVKMCQSKQQTVGTDPKCAFIPGQSQKCCGAVCADGFNTACKECLCASTKDDQPLSQEQCLDWICGGSKANWVCCHEEPIQNPAYYVVQHHEYILPEKIEGYDDQTNTWTTPPPGEKGEGEIFKLTAYAEPCFPEGSCTSKATGVNFGQVAGDPTFIPHKTRIVITSLIEGIRGDTSIKIKPNTEWTNSYENTNAGEDLVGKELCICDSGGDIKGNRLDIWLPGNDTANHFGVRVGTVQVIGEKGKDLTCCVPTSLCCQDAYIKKNLTTCKESDSGYGVICNQGSYLNTCKSKYKSEWNYINPICKKLDLIP